MDTRGFLDLRTRIESSRNSQEICVRYLLIKANTIYNVLTRRLCLNSFKVIISMSYLVMKFPFDKGVICTMHIDQKITQECYAADLKMTPYVPSYKTHRLRQPTNLHPQTNTEDRMEPQGEVKELKPRKLDSQNTKLRNELSK